MVREYYRGYFPKPKRKDPAITTSAQNFQVKKAIANNLFLW